MLEYIGDNLLLFAGVPVIAALFFIVRPLRRFLVYCLKNIISVVFFIFLGAVCPFLGYTLSLNVFTLAAVFLLGMPGISLVMFISLII